MLYTAAAAWIGLIWRRPFHPIQPILTHLKHLMFVFWTMWMCQTLPQRSRAARTAPVAPVCIRQHTASLDPVRFLEEPRPSRTRSCHDKKTTRTHECCCRRKQRHATDHHEYRVIRQTRHTDTHTHTQQSHSTVSHLFWNAPGEDGLCWPVWLRRTFMGSCGSIQRAISLPNGKPITAI